MRKTLFLIIVVLILSFTLNACKSNGKECEHQYDNYLYDGYEHWQACSMCNEELPRETHVFSEWIVIKDASEKEEGLRERRCKVCNYFEEEIIDRINHECKYIEEIIKPTCTEQGYTLFTCSCGNSYQDMFVEPTGHNMVDKEIILPTCESEGFEISECADCSYREETIIPPLQHRYGEWIVELAPTKDAEGIMLRSCEHDISHQEKQTLPALNSGLYDIKELISPSCTEFGKYLYEYIDGEINLSFTAEVEPFGHYYSEWKMISEPSLSESGLLTKVCVHDESHQEEIILVPLNKTNYQYRLVNSPSCEEEGLELYAFEIESQSFTFELSIEELGHAYSEWEVVTEPTFNQVGSIEKVCQHNENHKISHELPALNQIDYACITIIKATCEEEGIDEYQYSYDNKVFTISVVTDAIGHTYGEWVIESEPSVTSRGVLLCKCLNDDTHQKSNEIPSLNDVDYHVSTYLESTCEEEGSKRYQLVYQDQTFDFYLPIPAHGHIFDGWSYHIDPTLESSGSLINRCRFDDNHFEIYELPILNQEDYEFNQYRAATCEEEGLDTYAYY